MQKQLENAVIIITGAGSGIGSATALACAQAGMNVVLNGRREDRLSVVAERIRSLGRQAEAVPGDVTVQGTTAALLARAEEVFGGFHAVFANAGYGLQKQTIDLSTDDLRGIFEVNFFASVDLISEAARRLIERGQGGHLLMCSSCLAKFTLPWYGAYSATKAAQNHMCRAMNLELEPHGIAVTSVHPITTTTEFHEVSVGRSGGEPDVGVGVPDHAPKLFVQKPERVARAVVKCLRKPRPEVWTSHIVRFSAALMTMFPRVLDMSMRGQAARLRKREGASHPPD